MMRFSFFQLLLVLLALISCVSEEISSSEQPTRRSFFSKVGNVYKKTKQGLRNMFAWKRRGARGTEDEGHVKQNPIGEGIGAVMEAIDEIVADGEAAAKNAAKSAKEAVDNSEKAVEQTALESEVKLPPTANVEEEAETKMDRTHIEDGDDRNINTKDKVEAIAFEDENKEVKPASHDTASSDDDDDATESAVSDSTVPDRTAEASDTKEEL